MQVLVLLELRFQQVDLVLKAAFFAVPLTYLFLHELTLAAAVSQLQVYTLDLLSQLEYVPILLLLDVRGTQQQSLQFLQVQLQLGLLRFRETQFLFLSHQLLIEMLDLGLILRSNGLGFPGFEGEQILELFDGLVVTFLHLVELFLEVVKPSLDVMLLPVLSGLKLADLARLRLLNLIQHRKVLLSAPLLLLGVAVLPCCRLELHHLFLQLKLPLQLLLSLLIDLCHVLQALAHQLLRLPLVQLPLMRTARQVLKLELKVFETLTDFLGVGGSEERLCCGPNGVEIELVKRLFLLSLFDLLELLEPSLHAGQKLGFVVTLHHQLALEHSQHLFLQHAQLTLEVLQSHCARLRLKLLERPGCSLMLYHPADDFPSVLYVNNSLLVESGDVTFGELNEHEPIDVSALVLFGLNVFKNVLPQSSSLLDELRPQPTIFNLVEVPEVCVSIARNDHSPARPLTEIFFEIPTNLIFAVRFFAGPFYFLKRFLKVLV